jgi:hypothetical protein
MSAILMAASVQGCFFLDLKCKIEEFIQKEGSQLVVKEEQAFKQAMNHVLEDISPLLDEVVAAIDAGINKADSNVNDSIYHIEGSIRVIIHNAAQRTVVAHDIEEVIHEAASAMEQVENMFYWDASKLLTQINQIMHKGQCMEAGGAKQIRNEIYKLLKSQNSYYHLSSCWRSLGYKASMTLQDLTDMQLYSYQKQCTLLNKITPTTPIKGPGGILGTYAQGQLYAAEYHCIGETTSSPSFQDVLFKEWLWWGVQYNTWKSRMTSKKRGHKVHEGKLRDDPCGTPVECYAKAMKALQEAEQKIVGIQTGLLDLNRTVIANQNQVFINEKRVNTSILGLEANISGLKANVSVNGQAIKSNVNGIVTNKNAIATSNNSISKRLSTLTAYACNCIMVDSTICTSGISEGYCSIPVIGFRTRCCKLCVGTAKEAAAYALADPVPTACPAPDPRKHI